MEEIISQTCLQDQAEGGISTTRLELQLLHAGPNPYSLALCSNPNRRRQSAIYIMAERRPGTGKRPPLTIPSPTSVPRWGVRDPPRQWHILMGLTFYVREAVGMEEMTFVCLNSKSFHHPRFISLTFIFTKVPWEIVGTGEMWSSPEGKACVKEEEGELIALASHDQGWKRNAEPYLSAFKQ